MRVLVSSTLMAFILGGCANMQAQQEEKRLVAECQERWKDSKFDPIRGKVTTFERPSTRYILIEDKVATSEKELLLERADLTDECATKTLDWAIQYAPWILPAMAESRERSLAAFSELYHGRISYGEYNRLTGQSQAMYYDRWQKLQAEHARLGIAAQRNQLQASQNLLQAAQQLSPPPPQLQPNVSYTNCFWGGQHIRCTTTAY